MAYNANAPILIKKIKKHKTKTLNLSVKAGTFTVKGSVKA